MNYRARMRLHRLIPLVLLGIMLMLLGVQSDGPRQGRQGNALYEEAQFQEAIEAYQRGLQSYDAGTTDDEVYTALQNNLGAAHYRQQGFAEAREAFETALQSAPSAEAFTRAAYNAGNTAYEQGEFDEALEYYRRALRTDPDHEDARHNYEFIKRQQDQDEESLPGETDTDDMDVDDSVGDDESGGEDQEDEGAEDAPSPSAAEGEPADDEDADASPGDDAPPGEADLEDMSMDQALRILDALEVDELELLREALQLDSPRRNVEKEW